MNVTGTVESVERAFHVNLGVYRHPTEDRNFYAPDREPTADLPFALWHVTGLDNFSLPHPASRRRDDRVLADTTGSGPSGYFIGSDFRADLTTNGAGGSWKSETAWRDSGGGISPSKIAIPSYQTTTGVVTTANKGSKTLRNIPDVAAEANTDNSICYNGTCAGGWGGTSFAAYRWAGYLALVNQQSAAAGLGTLGFLNPTLYSIGLGSSHAANFHDITSGNNGTYTCQTGYDLVTGWGSPNGTGLINTLAP